MEHVVSQVLIALTTQVVPSFPAAGKELALIRRHMKVIIEPVYHYRERISAGNALLALTLGVT